MAAPFSSLPSRPDPTCRWRRLFQFSLRTLLLLTTVAAIACWWLLLPKLHVEELASGTLKLRRQVRQRAPKELRVGDWEPSSEFASSGAWRMDDRHNDPLVVGRYENGQPHGRWVVYHANGRKAVEGQMFHGLPVGLWKSYDEQGQRLSEVTYVVVRRTMPTLDSGLMRRARGSICGTTIPVVGTIGLIPGTPPVATMMGAVNGEMMQIPSQMLISQRHGPAKAWNPNGRLREEGNYRHDLRDGHWTFFAAAGRILQSGSFRAGLREGTWVIVDRVGGDVQTIDFIADRPRAEHERLFAHLRAELNSGQIERQITAMDRLQSLGQSGAALLIASLGSTSDGVKLLALRRLERLADDAQLTSAQHVLDPAALNRIESLLDSPDFRLSRLALITLYRQMDARREEFFSRLIEAVRDSDDGEWKLYALLVAWQADPQRRPQIFTELAHVMDEVWPSDVARCIQPTDDLPGIVIAAAQSPDAKVRRLAMEVVVCFSHSGQPKTEQLPGGGQRFVYPIPEQFRAVIQRAKHDSDEQVRQAAEAAGVWPDPRSPVLSTGPCMMF